MVPALTTYLYSSLCKANENIEISQLLNDGLRVGTFILIIFFTISASFSEQLIYLVYSADFITASKYVPYHMLGVSFFIWFSILSKSLPATGKIKEHGFFRFIYLTLDILINLFSCIRFWPLGWTAKYIFSPVIFFLIYFIYCRFTFKLRIKTENIFLMAYFLLTVSIVFLVNYFMNNLLILKILSTLIIISFIAYISF